MSEVGARRRRRTLIVLAGVAGVCALLGGLSFLPPERDLPRAEVGQRVLPAYESKTGFVSLIMVTTKEESYHIVRNGDANGGEWVLAEKGSYPVSPARIQDLNLALSTITYGEAMTRDERKFDRIGAGDPGVRGTGALLEVGDGTGNNFARLIVGFREGRSYVRRPDDLQVWAVDGAVLPPLQRATRWLDLAVVNLPAEDIAQVDVRPAQGPAYRLARSPDGGFGLAPPYHQRPVLIALGPRMVAEAVARFAPSDVAPAGEIAVGSPVAEHITRTRDGVAIVVRSWRAKEAGWVTVSAATMEGAGEAALKLAADINTRAAPWAFGLNELDWGAYSTPLNAIAE
jgi:Domain of unknown function (DUF4340)